MGHTGGACLEHCSSPPQGLQAQRRLGRQCGQTQVVIQIFGDGNRHARQGGTGTCTLSLLTHLRTHKHTLTHSHTSTKSTHVGEAHDGSRVCKHKDVRLELLTWFARRQLSPHCCSHMAHHISPRTRTTTSTPFFSNVENVRWLATSFFKIARDFGVLASPRKA